jgi:hypothetical protein
VSPDLPAVWWPLFMRPLCSRPGFPIESLRRHALFEAALKNRSKAMSDILGLVLGVGGIMLMAAYLVLCERI